MEVIAGASAIVQLLDVLYGLGMGVQNYIKRMKDAPDTIQTIRNDLEQVAAVLPKLKRSLETSSDTGILRFPDAEGELSNIISSLIELNCQLSMLLEKFKDVGTSKSVKLEWAASGKERAEELGKRLQGLKSSLGIVLQFSQMSFQSDQANKADEQNRIMMMLLERQARPEKQARSTYTQSWIESDMGTFAASVFSRVNSGMEPISEQSSEDEFYSISNSGSSGAHTPTRSVTGASSLDMDNLHESRRIRLMEELRQEVEREMRTVAYRARVAEKQEQMDEQKRRDEEWHKRSRFRKAMRQKSAALEVLMDEVAKASRRLELPTDHGDGGMRFESGITPPPVFNYERHFTIHNSSGGAYSELDSMITRYDISDREVLDLRTEDELLSTYTAHTVDSMTAAVASGDAATSAFCANLAKDLCLDVWAVRDELEDLVVKEEGKVDDDATTVVEEEAKEPVPSLDFAFMVKTYEEEIQRQKDVKALRERITFSSRVIPRSRSPSP